MGLLGTIQLLPLLKAVNYRLLRNVTNPKIHHEKSMSIFSQMEKNMLGASMDCNLRLCQQRLRQEGSRMVPVIFCHISQDLQTRFSQEALEYANPP